MFIFGKTALMASAFPTAVTLAMNKDNTIATHSSS